MLLSKLKNSYDFEKFTLTKGKRISYGRNNLSGLKWITYTITRKENDVVPEMWKQYDKILFTAYKIDADIQLDAGKRSLRKNSSTAKCPNVDLNSGNTHPDISKDNKPNKSELMQLVLASSNNTTIGPALIDIPQEIQNQEIPNDRYYIYPVCVPKACYYPLIDRNDEEAVMDEFGYLFLKKIWEEIHK